MLTVAFQQVYLFFFFNEFATFNTDVSSSGNVYFPSEPTLPACPKALKCAWLILVFRVKIMQTVSNSNQNHISSTHLGPDGDARKCFNVRPVCHQLIVTKMLLLIRHDGVTLMKPTFACNALCAESTALQAVSAPVWFLQKAPFPLFWCSVVFPSDLFQIAVSDISIWVNKMRSGWRHPGRQHKHPLPKIKAAAFHSFYFIPFILSFVSVHC